MNNRKAVYLSSTELDQERMKLEFLCPTRGMIGLRTELLNETQGTAVVKAVFHDYQKYSGPMKKNPKGAIISMCEGVTTPYALK
jgi:GTP-binding protein